jgi:hypothetical protein
MIKNRYIKLIKNRYCAVFRTSVLSPNGKDIECHLIKNPLTVECKKMISITIKKQAKAGGPGKDI